MTHAAREPASRRVFVPEAHMPRTNRLMIEPWGVTLEVGLGIQHRLRWEDCEAVVRFPDRLELVFGATSLVLRAAEWLHGDEALEVADRLMPPELRWELPGEPEPPAVPYRLTGLARTSAGILGLLLFSTLVVAWVCVAFSAAGRRATADVVALVFILPTPFLVRAIRQRLAVPRRWRGIASGASSTRVRVDGLLAGAPTRSLRFARVAIPVIGIPLAVWVWRLTGTFPVVVVVLVTCAIGYVNFELRRRRHR